MVEDTAGMIKELFQVQKWRKNYIFQAPMVRVLGYDFYTREFAHLRNGAAAYIKLFIARDPTIPVNIVYVEQADDGFVQTMIISPFTTSISR